MSGSRDGDRGQVRTELLRSLLLDAVECFGCRLLRVERSEGGVGGAAGSGAVEGAAAGSELSHVRLEDLSNVLLCVLCVLCGGGRGSSVMTRSGSGMAGLTHTGDGWDAMAAAAAALEQSNEIDKPRMKSATVTRCVGSRRDRPKVARVKGCTNDGVKRMCGREDEADRLQQHLELQAESLLLLLPLLLLLLYDESNSCEAVGQSLGAVFGLLPAAARYSHFQQLGVISLIRWSRIRLTTKSEIALRQDFSQSHNATTTSANLPHTTKRRATSQL